MINEDFLNEIALMINDSDDYMAAIVHCDKDCMDETYMNAIHHFNGLFYYFVTYGDTKLINYTNTIDLWINAYIKYRDFWDRIVMRNIDEIESDESNLKIAGQVITELSLYTHKLLDEIVKDLSYNGIDIEEEIH